MRGDGLIQLENVDTSALLREAEARFVLGRGSVHGPAHWKAVLANGMTLADELGVDRDLVAVFSLLHDCKREDEYRDPRHGARAADVAIELNGRFYDFKPGRLALLIEALRLHDSGRVHADIHISCCWTADRIELRRVGIEPAKWGFCDRTWPIAQKILAGRGHENADRA